MNYAEAIESLKNDEQIKINVNYSELVANHDWYWSSHEERIIAENPAFDHTDMYLQILGSDEMPSLCAVTKDNDSYVVISGDELDEDNIKQLIQFA